MTEQEHHFVYHSPVGKLRISATDSCVTAVHFMNDDEAMPSVDSLTPMLSLAVEQLMEYFNGARRIFDVPVSQSGTDFQQSVWNKLLEIPFGKTISYQELAKRLGDPKVIRAAATTNGKNKVAIIVPCHRVIGAKNDLVGYGGGLWRKKWLLQHEAKFAHGVQTLFDY
jgi:methylated-DNA-[protein]-cysteine S-methyltransferase